MITLALAWKGHPIPLLFLSSFDFLVKCLSSFIHSSQGRLPGDESWGLRYVVPHPWLQNLVIHKPSLYYWGLEYHVDLEGRNSPLCLMTLIHTAFQFWGSLFLSLFFSFFLPTPNLQCSFTNCLWIKLIRILGCDMLGNYISFSEPQFSNL